MSNERKEESIDDDYFDYQNIIIDPKQTQIRIDKFLMDRVKDISRNRVQNAIRVGAITVDGKKIKPNFKTLGKRLGPHMKQASQIIMGLGDDDIKNIESTGAFELNVDGQKYDLTLEDFDISAEEIPGWQVAQDGDITVALDINLTDELISEGMARELVNRIQNIRKDKGFDVTDRIKVILEDHEAIRTAIAKYGSYIKEEVLAQDISNGQASSDNEIELPGSITLKIDVEKV